MSEPLVLVDRPAEFVQRLTLNRPEKRNALNNALRGELFAALQAGDEDPGTGRATCSRAPSRSGTSESQ